MVSFNLSYEKIEKISQPVYLYHKANWQLFRDTINEQIASFLMNEDIENLHEKIVDFIKYAADRAIPKSAATSSRITNYPRNIVELYTLKNKYTKKLKKTQSSVDRENLSVIKSVLTASIEEFHSKKWNDFVKSVGTGLISSIPFWRRITLIQNGKKSNAIGKLIENGIIYENDQDKANLFAKTLKQTFSKNVSRDYDDDNESRVNAFLQLPLESHYRDTRIILFSEKEVRYEVKKLSRKKSVDRDGITNQMMRNIPDSMIVTLKKLFNLCLLNSKIPKSWKISEITMIPKKGSDRKSVKGYRPISILSCLSRLFERLVLRRLERFLRKNKIIVKQQSGFRHKRQTIDNLVFFSQKILEGFNR